MDVLAAPHAADAATRPWLAQAHRLFIGNDWVDAAGGLTFEARNPATGEIIATVAEAGATDIDSAVTSARRALNGPWHRYSPSDRGRLLWRIAELVEQHADELADLESLNNGKPRSIARSVDLEHTIDMYRYFAGWATKIIGETIPVSVPSSSARYFAYTQREPVGVVAAVLPWNFPLLHIAFKLGPALAAGCTVVLKPAEQTPLTALRFAELLLDAGLPAGVVNIVPGFGETAGAALAAHPDVDKITFTGSTAVGKAIATAAGNSNLKKVTLELGGKSPNVVFADADLDTAIDGAAASIFFNSGQVCCAGTRLYVEHKIFDDVVAGVADRAQRIKVGDGQHPETQLGPLISAAQLDRVETLTASGLNDGATAVTGAHRVGAAGYFYEPTVLVDTTPEMRVVKEEIFGPVVVAMPFDEPTEILPVANETVYGLAAGLWTRDISRAHAVASALRAGTVWINCWNVFDAALPFGGYRQSGWGREMGYEAIEAYTEVKAVCLQL